MDIGDQQRATLLGKFGEGFITELPVAHQKRKSSLQEVSSDLQNPDSKHSCKLFGNQRKCSPQIAYPLRSSAESVGIGWIVMEKGCSYEDFGCIALSALSSSSLLTSSGLTS